METTRTQLVKEVTDLVISSLNLHFVDKSTITEATTLMAGGLGLDSVDILEVVVAVEQKYSVKIQNADQGKAVFQNIGSICTFIEQNRMNQAPAPLAQSGLEATSTL